MMMYKFISPLLYFSILFSYGLEATVLTVNSNLDSQPLNGGVGVGTTGDLRYVLNLVNITPDAYQVEFSLPAGNEAITLQGMLPVLNQNALNTLDINGNNSSGSGVNVTLNGGGTQRGFIAQQGPITIQNMTIQNTVANGGAGGIGGGGGGLGAGSALFVNQAQVVLTNVNMTNNVAQGGNGGVHTGSTAGGGGMGGNGGTAGKAGGGGLGGNGGSDVTLINPAGGGGIGPGGNGGSTGLPGAAGGAFGSAEAGNAADGTLGGIQGGGGGSGTGLVNNGGGGGINGDDGTLASGGNGGFGGGGGGHFGNGGFGGGGGSNGAGGFGGGGGTNEDGGFGGGGAESTTAVAVAGVGGVGGGTGTVNNGGGAGAGLGGAIFINNSNEFGEGGGSVTINGQFFSQSNNAVSGTGGSTSAGDGAEAGDAIFVTSGSTPLIFSQGAGETATINESIADDSNNSLPGGEYTAGSGDGITIRKEGDGTLQLLGVNTFEGEVDLNAGILAINSRDSLGAKEVELNVTGNSTLQAEASFTSDQSIDLNANTLSVNTNGFTVELSGEINGTGGIKKIGNNILTLSGDKKYTGLTDVVQGELIVKNTTTKTISGDYNVAAGAVLDLEQRFDTRGDYTGVISGNGTLLINENNERGTVRLSGNSSPFNGATEVRNGVLDLTGTLGGNIQVFGTLSGNGTSLGDVRIKNGGRIAPGTGTFTVTKNYFQESGSTFLADLNPKNQFPLVRVKQAAILGENTNLGLLVPNGTRVNTRITLLNAEGGLSGQFTNVFTDSDRFFGTVFYDANNVFVVVTQNFNADAETCNQKALAEQMKELGIDLIPELQGVLQEFSTLDSFGVRNGLDQLSGVQFSNVLFTAELANRQFTRRIFDPLRILITANPCTPAVCCNYKSTFDVWAAITGGGSFIRGKRSAKRDCINDVKGFHISDFAITVGAHTKLLPQLTLGGAISYERDCISYSVGGNAKNDVVLLGGYALYRPPARFYILGDLIFGHNANEFRRSVNIGSLRFRPKANVSVNQASIYAEIGVDVPLKIVLFQPFFAFESGTFRFNNFKESGGGTLEQPVNPLILSVSGKTWTSAGTRLGVHLTSAPLLFGLSMGVDLSWNYRFTSQRNMVNLSFQDFGTPFKIRGLALQRNGFEGAIFFNQRINKTWSLYFEGNGLGWQNSFSFSFTGGVVASF